MRNPRLRQIPFWGCESDCAAFTHLALTPCSACAALMHQVVKVLADMDLFRVRAAVHCSRSARVALLHPSLLMLALSDAWAIRAAF